MIKGQAFNHMLIICLMSLTKSMLAEASIRCISSGDFDKACV